MNGVSLPPYEPPTIGMVRERIFIFDSVESTENCTEGERNFPQIFFWTIIEAY